MFISGKKIHVQTVKEKKIEEKKQKISFAVFQEE
jgi:hypothetical protein